MVERSECLSHGAVHESCSGLAVSWGGNDAIRDVPRPTPGSPKSTHHVREVRPCVVKVCVVDGDHLSGQLAFNPALIVAVPGKRLLLGENEIKRDRLPARVVKILGRPLRLALDRIDVREVGFSAVLPNNPEPRCAPAGPGIQASLKVSNLAGTFCGLTDSIEHRVPLADTPCAARQPHFLRISCTRTTWGFTFSLTAQASARRRKSCAGYCDDFIRRPPRAANAQRDRRPVPARPAPGRGGACRARHGAVAARRR